MTIGFSPISRGMLLLLLVLLPNGLPAEELYSARLAGRLYPTEPDALRTQVEGFLEKVPSGPLAGEPVAFVAPHAGYVYSGETAAYVYARLRDLHPRKLILLGPSHHSLWENAVLTSSGAFSTSLGKVSVEKDLATRLLELAGEVLRPNPRPFALEHSLEIHLPFLQGALKDGFQVVPILLPNDRFKVYYALAEALHKLRAEAEFVVVASTDLSHFHPRSRAWRLDETGDR